MDLENIKEAIGTPESTQTFFPSPKAIRDSKKPKNTAFGTRKYTNAPEISKL